MSAEATRDPQIAAALDHFDATLRGAIVDWLTRSPETGGHGLPPDVTPARALILQCLVEGLKVRETREPNLDRAQPRVVLARMPGALPARVLHAVARGGHGRPHGDRRHRSRQLAVLPPRRSAERRVGKAGVS